MADSKDPGRDPPHLDPLEAASAPTWRAAYSDRTAALMAALSQLAYVPFEVTPAAGGQKAVKPGGEQDLATLLDAGGFRLISLFNKDDTQAFLAILPDQYAVLAFRGTTSVNDWMINANVRRVDLPGVPGVRVHCGFLEAFQGCRLEIERAVNQNVPNTLGLYITGHSLGGGLAQIASAVLERDNLAACYTFGSPRVGTLGFDRQVKCPHYRLVNDWDVVPGVPVPWFHGYFHTGDPRLLTPDAKDQMALRRDRLGVSRFFVDLWALAVGWLQPRFLIVDDHMIWNYRTQLEAIASFRASKVAPPN